MNSFPELKRLLGINPDEKNERIRTKARKTGCEELFDEYHIGKPSRVDNMSKEELQTIADKCDTYKEFGEKLGYEDISCPSMGKKVVEKYRLDFVSKVQRTENTSLNPRRFDVDYVQNIVNESYTFAEVARALGYKNQNKIPHLLDKLEIDYSHFDPNRHKHGTRHSLDELQENTTFTNKVLRELLSQIGKIACEMCSCENQWNEKEITLEVHHRNGDHHDNRIENLMLVCPTCHAYIEGKIGELDKRKSNSFEYEILAERGHCCEECNKTRWKDGLIPLELHHIDGNHHNNIPENIKLLCPNCHSQTKTFGCKEYVQPVSDEEYVKALRNSRTIKEAILSLDRSVSGATYKRARKLAKQYNIIHLIPLNSASVVDISRSILNGESLDKIQYKWGISTKELCHIINGTHPLSSSDFVYPLIESKRTSDNKNKQVRKPLKVASSKSDNPVKYCCDCHKPIYHNGERCQECNIKHRRKDFPDKQMLKDMIRHMSFTEIGRKYNVNGNAVVRWCKYYELPWRKTDIDAFTDKEWDALEVFTDDMKRPRILHDHAVIIELLDKYHSAKYASHLLSIPLDTINDVRQQQHYRQHMIEWSPTTCHLPGTDLYFRTTTDAGHWLAERGTELKYVVPAARGKRVKRYIEQNELLFGYQFEYVKEEDYFGIIENHEVISYAYQEHREIPPQVKK